ncbi:MAG TPA: hypothetical protein VEA15_04655 [Caulobacteraceae bacterium]|nr:hypothetical protein [Caulobacteraceae bacterium]
MSDRPPPTREHYLKQAAHADELARRATTAAERASFEEIARLWRRLAESRGGPAD